jgi:hypothetical protein
MIVEYGCGCTEAGADEALKLACPIHGQQRRFAGPWVSSVSGISSLEWDNIIEAFPPCLMPSRGEADAHAAWIQHCLGGNRAA